MSGRGRGGKVGKGGKERGCKSSKTHLTQTYTANTTNTCAQAGKYTQTHTQTADVCKRIAV